MQRIPSAVATGLGLGLLLLAGAAPALAQATGDVAVLAGSCANCHGTDGRSPGSIPSIAGRPEAVLRAQLKAFKADTAPPGTTIMHRLVKGYSDEQLDALAVYFAKINAKTETKPSAKGGKK